MTRLCRRCWHAQDAHEHYISGQIYCSECDDCPRFRWVAWPWNRGKTPRPSVADGAEAWLAGREAAAGEEAA